MTKPLIGKDIAKQIAEHIPDAVAESSDVWVVIKPELLLQAVQFLNTTPGLDFNFLNCITGVDYLDYIEVVYHLTSMDHNHSLVLKVRCDREKPVLPSLYSLFRGADYQEREIYDLLGVRFTGHPNLKRLFMWESFEGHPLRRDYL
ncbi:NADH-quinone oxidoreductase subunit C [Chloroflexota bacterium]